MGSDFICAASTAANGMILPRSLVFSTGLWQLCTLCALPFCSSLSLGAFSARRISTHKVGPTFLYVHISFTSADLHTIQVRRTPISGLFCFVEVCILFSLFFFSLTISHNTGERMCGSKSRTFSLPSLTISHNTGENVGLFEPHIFSSSRVPSPTTQERECAVLRTARSPFLLHPISHNTGERTCGSKSRTFSLPLACCLR